MAINIKEIYIKVNGEKATPVTLLDSIVYPDGTKLIDILNLVLLNI